MSERSSIATIVAISAIAGMVFTGWASKPTVVYATPAPVAAPAPVAVAPAPVAVAPAPVAAPAPAPAPARKVHKVHRAAPAPARVVYYVPVHRCGCGW